MRLKEIATVIEERSPLELQESWDNSGFQIKLGNPEITKLLVALEVTDSVIDEAMEQGVRLIVTHHPLIFGNISQVDNNNIIGNYLCRLIQAGISVYSSHTPFDKCAEGNNDYLAKKVGLSDVRPLEDDESGICREGHLMEPKRVIEYIETIMKQLDLDKGSVRFAGDANDFVEKVGICTGAGAEFMETARDAGCDLFITGDVKYHTGQLAHEIGMNLLDIGHYGSEYLFVANMVAYLRESLPTEVFVYSSGLNLDPFKVF